MAALLVSLALGCEHCERGLGRPLPKSCTGHDVHNIAYEAPFELRGEHAACLQPRLGWQSFDAVAAAVILQDFLSAIDDALTAASAPSETEPGVGA